MRGERGETGQMHTLEGLSAAMILIIAAFYASQAIAIAPTSSSTASKAAEAELQRLGEDVLAQAYSNGDLREALLYWNDSKNKFKDAENARYYTGNVTDDIAFGQTLNSTFDERGIAYNIEIHYLPVTERLYNDSNNATIENTPNTRYLVNGEPTDNAVVASQKIVLRHEDLVDGGPMTLNETSTYPISGFVNETAPTTTLYREHMYNVVEVRMIIWRT